MSAEAIKNAIDRHIEDSQEDPRRDHLGASLIGKECERQLWYSWRWAKAKRHDAKLLRLFNRGHLEEFRFEEWLIAISDEFWPLHPETGEQIRISDFHGYFGGSLDGVIRNPAGLKGDYLTEFKTHGEKSFSSLCLHGVQKNKPEHYTQMQIYLHYKPKLKAAIYFAINKNTDALHVEVIERDEAHALEQLEKAKRILLSENPPPAHDKAYNSSFMCKFCDFHGLCYSNEVVDKSCRTCSYVQTKDSGWHCKKHNIALDSDKQRSGCDEYERIE